MVIKQRCPHVVARSESSPSAHECCMFVVSEEVAKQAAPFA